MRVKLSLKASYGLFAAVVGETTKEWETPHKHDCLEMDMTTANWGIMMKVPRDEEYVIDSIINLIYWAEREEAKFITGVRRFINQCRFT